MRITPLAALAPLAVALAPLPALAQDTTVPVAGLLELARPYIEVAVGAAVMAVIGWLAAVLKRWTGIEIEARQRKGLHEALQRGVARALARLGDRVSDAEVDVRSEIVALTVDYVARRAPERLEDFGLAPEDLEDLIEGHMPDWVGRSDD